MRVLNVAHGSFFAIGGYAAASLSLLALGRGLPAWVSLPVLLLASVLCGLVLGPPIARLLRRMQDGEPVLQLLVTFALFMILEDVQKLVWGVQPVVADAPVKLLGTVDVPFGGDVIPFNAYQLFLLPGVALLTLLGLAVGLRRTLWGRTLVAVTADREAARAIGINAGRVTSDRLRAGHGARRLSAARWRPPPPPSCPAWGRKPSCCPSPWWRRPGWARWKGAAVSALLIGLGRSLAVNFAPELEVVVPYLIMLGVLLVRPQGLFGVRGNAADMMLTVRGLPSPCHRHCKPRSGAAIQGPSGSR